VKDRPDIFRSADIIPNGLLFAAAFVSLSCFILDDTQVNRFAIRSPLSERIVLSGAPRTGPLVLAVDVRPSGTNASVTFEINGRFTTNVRIRSAAVSVTTDYKAPTLINPHEANWIFVPLASGLLSRTNDIRVTDLHDCSLFFRLPSRQTVIPSMFLSTDIEGVYGYPTDRDSRLYVRESLTNAERRMNASRVPGGADANLFLGVREKGDYWVDGRYSQINQANTKYIALLNPIDAGIVVWSEGPPGPGFVRAADNLRVYLPSEIDRFKSGLTIY
jgi:hypothetical protein